MAVTRAKFYVKASNVRNGAACVLTTVELLRIRAYGISRIPATCKRSAARSKCWQTECRVFRSRENAVLPVLSRNSTRFGIAGIRNITRRETKLNLRSSRIIPSSEFLQFQNFLQRNIVARLTGTILNSASVGFTSIRPLELLGPLSTIDAEARSTIRNAFSLFPEDDDRYDRVNTRRERWKNDDGG